MKTENLIILVGALLALMFVVVLVAITCSTKAFTVEHDGHRWVKGTSGALTHHPDCTCKKGGEP